MRRSEIAIPLVFIALLCCLPASAQLQRLTFRPVHAEYSQALDRIVMISSNPNQLHVYDPNTNSFVSLSLAKAPLNFSLSVDGRRAAVAHDALVTYVDLVALSVIRMYPISVQATDAIPAAEWIHVPNLGSIRISDGSVSGRSLGYYGNIKGRLHPSGLAIYGTRDGLSPNDVERYDVSTGPATESADSPYHGDYSFCGRVWFNPAADRIYTSCGTVVRAAPKQSNDMYFRGTLRGAVSIQSLSESSLHIATLEGVGLQHLPPPFNIVRLFDPVKLTQTAAMTIPDFAVSGRNFTVNGRWIFFNNQGSRIWAIGQVDSNSGLLNDHVIYSFDLSDSGTCSATFQPATSVQVASSGNLFTRTVQNTLDCVYQPTSSVPWIRILDLRYGSGSRTMSVEVLPNPAATTRSGEIRIGGQTLRVDQDAAPATPPTLQQLDFKVRDAEYDKTLDRLIIVSNTFPELIVYNPDAPAQSLRIPLSKPGLSVGVAPGGRFAAVGHDGSISHVNLETGAILRTYDVDSDVNDIVYNSNGFFYCVPAREWSDAYSVSIATGLVSTTSAIYDGRVLRLHPRNRYIYFSKYWASKWDTVDGPFRKTNSWTYAGYHGTSNIWISEDGNRIFSADSKVYRSSDIPAEDVQANGTLSGAADKGTRWADHSSIRKTVAIVPGIAVCCGSTPDTNDREVQLYGDEALAFAGRLPLGRVTAGASTFATGGRYLFWNRAATGLVALSQVESAANLTADFAVELIRDRPCPQLNLPVSSLNRNSDAFSYSVAVTAATGCMWMARSNADWITLTDGLAGFGDSGTVQMQASANFTGASRSGTVTIGSRTFTVTQAPAAATVRLSSSSVTFSSNASAAGFNVEATPGFRWTAQSDQPWIEITFGASGIGNGAVTVQVPENTSFSARTGTVSVASARYTVTQEGRFQISGTPLRFVPLLPCRIVDTRLTSGPFGGPFLPAQDTRSFDLPDGPCINIPATAKSYALNLTVVPRGPLGFVTIFPKGSTRPIVSTLNSLDGRIKANAAIVPAGANGGVSVYSTDATDMIIDIAGYFVAADELPAGLMFYPLPPCRVLDSRLPTGAAALAREETRAVRVRGVCGVPENAQAFSLNATVVPNGPLGYLTLWSTGFSRPIVSNLNALSGAVVANAAIIPSGPDGSINAFVTNSSHLVLDINGYFAPPVTGGLNFYSTPPCRLMDTRDPAGEFGGPFIDGQTTRNVSPARALCQINATAQAVSMNATVVPPASLSYLTLFPAGSTMPIVSTLNAVDGSITSNAAIVPVSTNGWLSAFLSHRSHLLLDLNGFFAP
jgi:hypothetical protein